MSTPVPPNESPKTTTPFWVQVLNSNGFAAVLTVLVGGIFGQLITASIQEGAQRRQFQQEWLKARGEQALLAHREYLTNGQQLVRDMYLQLGKVLAAADSMIYMTQPAWDPDRYSREEAKRIKAQRAKLRERFNTTVNEWSPEATGIQLSYYFGASDDSVPKGWVTMKRTLDDYLLCARGCYMNWETCRKDGAVNCQKKRAVVEAAVAELAVSLGKQRQYLWAGWESPEKLQRELGLALESKPPENKHSD
jgi:hypothetical protein